MIRARLLGHLHSNVRGFTLMEVLLSVSIIAILTGLSAPIYASFQVRNDVDITTQSIADMLRRAQTYARGNSGDSQWGVRIQSDTATLFKGSTYAARVQAYDETTTIPGSMAPSGLINTDVVFTKLDAAPSSTGSITLTTNTNETRTITINAKGMVTY